jgi:hypothetical protein
LITPEKSATPMKALLCAVTAPRSSFGGFGPAGFAGGRFTCLVGNIPSMRVMLDYRSESKSAKFNKGSIEAFYSVLKGFFELLKSFFSRPKS